MLSPKPRRRRGPIAALAAVLAMAAALLGAVTSPPVAQAAGGCQVTYTPNQWTGGFTASITIAVGSTAVNGWTLTWAYASGQQVTSAWNATVTQSGTAVSATNMSYNGAVPANGSVQFGVQGTWTSSDPTPTTFVLNGSACNGGTTSPTPSTSSAGPSPSSSPTVSPSPSTSPTTGPSPTTGTGGCGGAVICDGFESLPAGTPTGSWAVSYPSCSGTGTATIDTSTAHSGTRSLRIDGAVGYCNHVFVGPTASLASIGPVWYARFYVRHTTALPTSHVTFVAMRDANDGGNDLRMGGQNGALQWNRQSDDATLPAQSPAGVAMSMPLPVNQWSCVEFMVNGTAGTMQTWLNGTTVPGLVEDGVPTQDIDAQWLSRANWHPSLTDFRLGWESYGDGADTLWFDDVALGSSRIGC